MSTVVSFTKELAKKTGPGTDALVIARAKALNASRAARNAPTPPVGTIRTKATNWLKLGDRVTAPKRFGDLEGDIVATHICTATHQVAGFCVDFGHLKTWMRPADLKAVASAVRLP